MATVPTSLPATDNAAVATGSQVNGQATAAQNTTQQSNSNVSSVNWESELQLVSSLAKLQELERKIHELRQLVPDGLLEPLGPMSSNHNHNPINLANDSPGQLRGDLDRTARSRLTEIEQFQNLWRGPEMKPVWERVEARIQESKGQPLQPTGKWERDYDVLFETMVQAQKAKEETRLQEEEDAERTKAQSSDSEWQAVVERFNQRNVPGVRVVRRPEPQSLAIALVKAGMVFRLEGIKESGVSGVDAWEVTSGLPSGKTPTKFEATVLKCLNARPRKWDLAFLLDMLSSYADVKNTICVKCGKLTNNAAQLPVIRQAQSTHLPPGVPRTYTFDAFHSACI
ncbi:hypothetical protein N7462_008566 [Penicillium macrosclerotiorum]|uniref:uncharacterized protein n=1 Tax=Penicillium macrosclerotiorum TaxID=303699 RepID=UPI002546A932|nr:uncharacterized protein N7462_008566 [Penicillium macrosclerotiorum]KAJ5675669.1 hypothetical protein N7462_008566 [Penicillium macrosclerotiorum]